MSTIIGTLCAYGLWKRNAPVLSGSLYLSLVTPEIVTGISLLAFFQAIFRFLHLQLGMHTVILAHVAFSIAYVVIVVMARLRTMDAHTGRSGARSGRQRVGSVPVRDASRHLARRDRRGAAGVYRVVRRLRDYQPGGGRRFGDAADGDLRDRAARREPDGECHLGADRIWTWAR